MRSNKIFFAITKRKLADIDFRKRMKYAFIALIILIPGLVAVLNYVFVTNDIHFEMPEICYVTLYDSNGNVIASESDAPQYASSSSLVGIFNTMTTRLTKPSSNISPDYGKSFRAVIQSGSDSSEYIISFSFIEKSSYCVNAAGQTFLIDDRDVVKFLSSQYSQLMYDSANQPLLQSSAGDLIIPSSADWSYRTLSQKFYKSRNLETTQLTMIYDMAGALGLSFTSEPDECIVKIYEDNSQIYEGTPSGISQITFDTGTILHFFVNAVWNKYEECEFYGELTYDFNVFVRDRSEFSLIADTVEAGGLTVISCTHIIDTSKIKFTCVPDIGVTPVFQRKGENVFAVLPFSSGTPVGAYSVTLTYGATVQAFTVNVTSHAAGSVHSIDTENESISTATTQYAQNIYKELISLVTSSFSDTVFIRDAFLSPQDIGADTVASFGDILEITENGNRYVNDGAFLTFAQKGGADIGAMNNGIVVMTGHCDYLGNYIVISHGYGICTWYAHLSEICVKTGDILVKGEILGRSGIGGMAEDEGVFILCTVVGITIDPKYLFGKAL